MSTLIKNIYKLIALVVLSMLLFACGQATTPGANTSPTPQPTATATAVPTPTPSPTPQPTAIPTPVPTPTPTPMPSKPWTGETTGWAKVRTGPTTSAPEVTTYAPGTIVTVYATVNGEIVWDGIAQWYRISSLSSAPRYIYGGLIAAYKGGQPGPVTTQGKVIVVSISQQWMYVYQDGKAIYNAPVTTGQPDLPTPTGTYHIFNKLSPTTFYSPWPEGSPYWYPPSHINYALEWKPSFFLHDSWWRSVYGPGTNVWHDDPVYGRITGTHGCITMPLNAAQWLYNWAPIGTTVQVNA